jgi:hypothetical protein
MLVSSPGRRPRLLLCLALPLLALTVPSARAADDKPAVKPEPRVPVAVCVTDTATLLRREAPDKPWQIVKENEELSSGDLILGGAEGALDSKDGAVRLAVVGDVDGSAPLPVLETAFVLHEPKDVDLDLTLDRGRIRLINIKKEGSAKVRIRTRTHQGEVTLDGPGTTLSIEIYGRWPRGVPFRKEAKAGEEPGLMFTLLAIKGHIHLKSPRRQLTMRAPPGHAVLAGDSLEAPEPAVGFLKELPEWAPEHLADLGNSERGKKSLAVMAQWRKRTAEKGLPEATAELLKSDDPMTRRFGVLLLAAMDDLEPLGEALKTTTHQDIWDSGILALRHWIGREPGQDQKLYQGLIDKAKLSPREAEGFMQLLHSFGEDEITHPELYQVLINYLGSDRVSLRQLAYWHLQRLVPAGRKIGYEPLASKEKRDAAIKEWRKLIPPGEMPPKGGE